jgi:Rrf2 family protein
MKTLEGVEWAAHACAVLAGLSPGSSLTAAALADFHKLPAAYMAKHLQALVRAGILAASRGGRGGYRLARRARDINLWDIQAAIEGSEPSFRCQDIRRRGPCARYTSAKVPCDIACAFVEAEASYRAHLKAISVAEITKGVAAKYGSEGRSRFSDWARGNGAEPLGTSREALRPKRSR